MASIRPGTRYPGCCALKPKHGSTCGRAVQSLPTPHSSSISSYIIQAPIMEALRAPLLPHLLRTAAAVQGAAGDVSPNTHGSSCEDGSYGMDVRRTSQLKQFLRMLIAHVPQQATPRATSMASTFPSRGDLSTSYLRLVSVSLWNPVLGGPG